MTTITYGTGLSINGIYPALAQHQANFPACKHFWQFTQADIVAKRLTDVMGGLVLNAPNITVGTVPGSARPNSGSNDGIISGSLYVPAGKPLIWLTCGKWGSGTILGEGAFVYGDKINGPCIRAGQTSGTPRTLVGNDGSYYVGPDFTTTSAAIGRAVIVTNYNSATGFQGIEIPLGRPWNYSALAAASTAVNSVPAAVPLNFNTFAPAIPWTCTNTTEAVFAAALFVFNTALPPDYPTACSWMVNAWAANDKQIYPPWAGLT